MIRGPSTSWISLYLDSTCGYSTHISVSLGPQLHEDLWIGCSLVHADPGCRGRNELGPEYFAQWSTMDLSKNRDPSSQVHKLTGNYVLNSWSIPKVLVKQGLVKLLGTASSCKLQNLDKLVQPSYFWISLRIMVTCDTFRTCRIIKACTKSLVAINVNLMIAVHVMPWYITPSRVLMRGCRWQVIFVPSDPLHANIPVPVWRCMNMESSV